MILTKSLAIFNILKITNTVLDRKRTRLNYSHGKLSRIPSYA